MLVFVHTYRVGRFREQPYLRAYLRIYNILLLCRGALYRQNTGFAAMYNR